MYWDLSCEGYVIERTTKAIFKQKDIFLGQNIFDGRLADQLDRLWMYINKHSRYNGVFTETDIDNLQASIMYCQEVADLGYYPLPEEQH